MKISRSHAVAAGIARAFHMAVLLPSQDRVRLRVRVLSRGGALLAEGDLRGFDQAAFLRDQLQPLGFFEYAPPPERKARARDLVLRQLQGDTSTARLVRKPPPQAWPPPA